MCELVGPVLGTFTYMPPSKWYASNLLQFWPTEWSAEVGGLMLRSPDITQCFNSRCLHEITGEEYRDTAISPAYNLLLAVRQRRLRYLGHLLRLPRDSVVRRTLIAMTDGGQPEPLPGREHIHGLPGFRTERP